MSFSPTVIKNYPVQAFSTGDVVPMLLGRVFRRLHDPKNRELFRGKALLINTQHDSIIMDVRREVLPDVITLLKEEMTDVKEALKECFGIDDYNINTTVGITYGKTWKDEEAKMKYTRYHDTGVVKDVS